MALSCGELQLEPQSLGGSSSVCGVAGRTALALGSPAFSPHGAQDPRAASGPASQWTQADGPAQLQLLEAASPDDSPSFISS